jgi:hypothetical protein
MKSTDEIITNQSIIERGSLPSDIDSLINKIEKDLQRFKRLSKLNAFYIDTKESIKTAKKVVAVEEKLILAEKSVVNATEKLKKAQNF